SDQPTGAWRPRGFRGGGAVESAAATTGRSSSRQGRRVSLAPAAQGRGLAAKRPGSRRHSARVGPAGEIALRERRPRAPGCFEFAVPNLPADLLVRLAEGNPGTDELFRGIGGQE